MSQVNVNEWSQNTQWVKTKRLRVSWHADVTLTAVLPGLVLSWACDAADAPLDLTNYWNLSISSWDSELQNCVSEGGLCSWSFSLYYTCVDTVTCELSFSITFKEYIYLNEWNVHKYFLNTAVNYCTFLLMLLFTCFDIMNEPVNSVSCGKCVKVIWYCS